MVRKKSVALGETRLRREMMPELLLFLLEQGRIRRMPMRRRRVMQRGTMKEEEDEQQQQHQMLLLQLLMEMQTMVVQHVEVCWYRRPQ